MPNNLIFLEDFVYSQGPELEVEFLGIPEKIWLAQWSEPTILIPLKFQIMDKIKIYLDNKDLADKSYILIIILKDKVIFQSLVVEKNKSAALARFDQARMGRSSIFRDRCKEALVTIRRKEFFSKVKIFFLDLENPSTKAWSNFWNFLKINFNSLEIVLAIFIIAMILISLYSFLPSWESKKNVIELNGDSLSQINKSLLVKNLTASKLLSNFQAKNQVDLIKLMHEKKIPFDEKTLLALMPGSYLIQEKYLDVVIVEFDNNTELTISRSDLNQNPVTLFYRENIFQALLSGKIKFFKKIEIQTPEAVLIEFKNL